MSCPSVQRRLLTEFELTLKKRSSWCSRPNWRRKMPQTFSAQLLWLSTRYTRHRRYMQGPHVTSVVVSKMEGIVNYIHLLYAIIVHGKQGHLAQVCRNSEGDRHRAEGREGVYQRLSSSKTGEATTYLHNQFEARY